MSTSELKSEGEAGGPDVKRDAQARPFVQLATQPAAPRPEVARLEASLAELRFWQRVARAEEEKLEARLAEQLAR